MLRLMTQRHVCLIGIMSMNCTGLTQQRGAQALVAAIRGRAQHTANFVDALEAKYAPKAKAISKRAADTGAHVRTPPTKKRGDKESH